MAQFNFPDKIEMVGDAVDYQSIAVNFVEGYGFPIKGGIVDSTKYKFYENPNSLDDHNWHSFYQIERGLDSYRNPIYMIFVAGVTKYLQ